jgi:HSP20 family protein
MPMRTIDLLDDLNRAYSNLFRAPGHTTEHDAFATGDWLPPADVKEEPDRFVVTLDVPGVPCEQIDVTVHEGILNVRGRRETEAKKSEAQMVRIERVSGRFVRQFHLPGPIEAESVSANAVNGVLVIVVPKAKASMPKRIQVR